MTADNRCIDADDDRLSKPERSKRFAACLAVALSLLLPATGPAWAGFDDGMAAAKRGDHQAAYDIWLPLAERGDMRAQYNLGVLYDQGMGVPQNFPEAAKWYLAAAQKGHTDAEANLGYAYEQGRGVAQDFGEAAKWYRRAAERGDIAAQANLGTLYANGLGVEQDDVRAHMWFNLAASQTRARKARRRLMRKRNSVAARLSPEQLAEAQRLAQEWLPKAP